MFVNGYGDLSAVLTFTDDAANPPAVILASKRHPSSQKFVACLRAMDGTQRATVIVFGAIYFL